VNSQSSSQPNSHLQLLAPAANGIRRDVFIFLLSVFPLVSCTFSSPFDRHWRSIFIYALAFLRICWLVAATILYNNHLSTYCVLWIVYSVQWILLKIDSQFQLPSVHSLLIQKRRTEAWKTDGKSVRVVHLYNCSNFGSLRTFLGNSFAIIFCLPQPLIWDPIRRIPQFCLTGSWRWPLTSTYSRGAELVEKYLQLSIRLHGVHTDDT
jgi:hypothetical protein